MYPDLLPFCEEYNVGYATLASPDNDAQSIAYVLRFPLTKVYVLNETPKDIPYLRKRFESNNRIQIFHNSHKASFFEISRMIPVGTPAAFILKEHEQVLMQWLSSVAANRPRKNDIFIITNKDSNDSAIFDHIARLYGREHVISMKEEVIWVVPAMKFKTKDLEHDAGVALRANR